MLLQANRVIRSIQENIESMMKVSARYGKKMGTMGTEAFNSATGSSFSRSAAEMMIEEGSDAEAILGAIMKKAEGANMHPHHMKRMNEVADRIRGILNQGVPRGSARAIRNVF